MILSFIGQPVFLLEPQLLRIVITNNSETTAKINFFILLALYYAAKIMYKR